MSTVRAFELREGIDAELFAGSVTMGDGTSFDVAAALAENDDLIVTDEEALIVALDAYPSLKRATVPEDQRGYDGKKKDELVAEAEARNVEFPDGATKDQIIDALREADAQEGGN